MDGPVILRRLAALRRSRITQTAPARYFDGGGIGGSGATVVQMVVHSTCRAQSQVAESLELLGYRSAANPSRPHHFPSETRRKYSDIPILCPKGRTNGRPTKQP